MAQFTHTNILTTSIKLLKKALASTQLSSLFFTKDLLQYETNNLTHKRRGGANFAPPLYTYISIHIPFLQLQHFVRQIPSLGDFFIHNLTLGNIQAFKQLLVVGTSLAPAFIGKL